jgi:hypothetical protein
MSMFKVWKTMAAAGLLAAGTAMAVAQGPGAGPGAGYGPGGGYGPGMMQGYGWARGGWSGKAGRQFASTRLDALRDTLKITDDQRTVWDIYAKAVTDAQQDVWNGMRAMMQPGTMQSLSPDQRFAFMQQIVDLRKQAFDKERSAAKALMPHLTEYQKGQASVLLPGMSSFGYGFGMGYGHPGFGHGWGMMGGYGGYGGYGPGMMGYGP